MSTPTIGSEIDDARERYFVGREAELSRLDACCREGGPDIAYVHGPGGVGKSELLRVFARRWQRLGAAVATIDARTIVEGEQGFSDAVHSAERDLGRPFELLIVDSLDHIWHLERWLRETYLPSLPSGSRLVLAGRDPLDPVWLISPAWRSRLDSVAVGNLPRKETCLYLERLGVAKRHHQLIYETSFGHPLATALLAEIGLRTQGELPHLGRLPDTVQTILSHLVREVVDDAQRLSLWCAALVPALSEELLHRMIPAEFESALFEWLRTRSFVEATKRGLVLHDLARASLTADVQWRSPAIRRRLVERALDEYVRRMESPDGNVIENGRSVVATMRLFGHHTSVLNHDFRPSALYAGDWPKLEAMVARHEGEQAAKLARFWRDRGAEITVVRGSDGEPEGCVITLWLDRIDRRDAAHDPGVLPLFSHLEATGGLDDGRVYLIRFWMGRESYQSFNAPVASALMTRILTQPFVENMAWGFSAHGDPGSLLAVSSSLDHYPDCSFVLGDRHFHVMGHDFRDDPPARWFRRVLTSTIRPATPTGLDLETFTDAVRDALRFIRQLDKLATSPLLRSHLLAGVESDDSPSLAAVRLQSLLVSEIERLSHADGDSTAFQVLQTTCLGKPIKHRAAAAELGMSYSTYRRRYADAVGHLVETFWQRARSDD